MVVQNDAETIERALRSFYRHVEAIVVTTDPARGWSGVPVEPDETLRIIRTVDTDKKTHILEGDFFRFADPLKNETYQRQRTVDILVSGGVMEDASKIWWDLRPSARFPTLEMRITDVCTRLEDAVCVAAMFVAVLRMLYRIRRANQTWRSYPLFLLSENRWRAQRYGVAGTLFDFGKGELVPFADLVEELLGLLHEDAEALGCSAEMAHARTASLPTTTVQPPQTACPQPNFVPVRPRSSRNTQSSMRVSSVVMRVGLPFSVKDTVRMEVSKERDRDDRVPPSADCRVDVCAVCRVITHGLQRFITQSSACTVFAVAYAWRARESSWIASIQGHPQRTTSTGA